MIVNGELAGGLAMRWRKTAVVGGAALGAAALYNATSNRELGDDDVLGGEADEFRWRGHRIAFTRHGEGRPVLLLHGIYPGASSFEWRHVVPALAERHRVIAVDLLGFGRSDRPAARYTPGLYQALLGDLIARVVREPGAVVASGLTAAQLVALAGRDPRHIASVALVAPTGVAFMRDPTPSASATKRLLLRAPLVGNTIYNGLTSPATLRRRLESIYVDDRMVTPALVQHYVRMARQPGGKHPIAALLSGKLNVDVRVALRRVRQPTMLLWGDLARENSVERAHAFRVIKHDLEWSLVQDAGDLPHDERPDEFNAALRSFLERARRWSGSGGSHLAMA
jgi:pimeloyl-ACP methyl ester carboxylesterase